MAWQAKTESSCCERRILPFPWGELYLPLNVHLQCLGDYITIITVLLQRIPLGQWGAGGGLSDQSPNWVQISGQSWIKLRKPHSLLQTITIISFCMWTENIFLQQKEELNGWPWNGHRVWKQKKEMVFSSDVGGYECEQAKRGDVWVFYYCITNCHKFSSLKQHVLISS